MARKRLIVFWKLFSMSGDVAKKAMCQGGKTYIETPQISEFPPDTDPEKAAAEILSKHGERPKDVNPFRGIASEHSFAEITGWKVADAYEKTTVKEERHEELPLL